MQSCFLPVLAGILLSALGPAPAQDPALSAASLWNVPQLLATPPAVETGAPEGLTKPVWYAGESYQGKPTRIFAWLGEPAGGAVSGKHPAVLLVHGGGGKAFQDWARHWAERGYVALAMDTAGQGPDGKRHAEGGPGQDDDIKFKDFTNSEAKDMWTYHAVAAVLRGHALLASLPQVDAARIGVS
jgi:dipeptidyl aminopeptidase/acylaminoacyl peptidase